MGLFLGCSLLFFVEIIEIIFNIIYISIKKILNQNQNTNENSNV
jgi:hypothetical protein